MGTVYPMPLTAFFDKLKIDETSCELSENAVSNETEGGEIITVGRGSRYWYGTTSVAGWSDKRSGYYTMLMARATAADASILIRPVDRDGPTNDPTGSKFESIATTIDTITTDRETVKVSGLPSNFELKQGDYFRVTFSGRHYLHQVGENTRASSTGVIAALPVYPPLAAAIPNGHGLSFYRPYIKAKIVPKSYVPPKERKNFETGFSFSWRQVFN